MVYSGIGCLIVCLENWFLEKKMDDIKKAEDAQELDDLEKKLHNLTVLFANKEDLIPKILEILENPAFCGQKSPDTKRLELLLEKGFDDKVRFVIESPYVDRHYRDTYYSFHSSKFNKVGRDCIRVHLFDGEVTETDLFDRENKLNERYWGFFIIRPLLHSILGRSLISPKAYAKNEYVCCLMKARVSLLGNELMAYGFPHIAQDKETHTCAESALWCYIEYFGSKYPQYKPLLPSQIIKTLLDTTEHRLLPSKGLSQNELAKCLQNNGFQCQIYPFSNPLDEIPMHFQLIQTYIESGIPLLLILGGDDHGHVVLAIGHQEDDSIYDPQNIHFPDDSSWVDVSYFNKKLVLIDENKPPYQIVDISKPIKYHIGSQVINMDVKCFIVPFPVHMFLVAEKVYAMVEKIFKTKIVGLQANGENGEKWITRIFLTGSRSFKEFLFKADKPLEPILRTSLLSMPLPKFIYGCEIYRAHEYKKGGHCSGLLIIDATSDGTLPASVLFYMVDNNLFLHDNVSWVKKPTRIVVPFRMKTYRNNLKGEWNKWKS